MRKRRSPRANLLQKAVAEMLEARTLLSTSYSITDIGTLPGGDFSDATGINASGQVVGYSHNSAGADRAVLWTAGGGIQDLGTLPGDASSRAEGINSQGDVVGFSTDSNGVDRAFLWTAGGGMHELDTLLGGAANEAFAINDSGQIVGQAVAGGGTQHAFLFNEVGGGQDLGTLGTAIGNYSFATDINNAGQVVGLAETTAGAYHAFLWTSQTGMQDLGALTPTDTATAFGINATGQIVGNSGQGQTTTAFVYTAGGTGGPASNPPMQPLGNLGGASNQANAINATGQIVGFSELGVDHSTDASIWDNSTTPEDLNHLIPAHSGWALDQGESINDSGQIVGSGPSPGGANHGFLLTPVGLLAPGAVVSAPDLTTAGATEVVTVNYISDAAAIDTSTITASGLSVTDSDGVPLGVTLTNVTGAGNSVTASYAIAAPGGTWDAPDTGTYTVAVVAGSVKDANGAGVLPVTTSFDVNLTIDPTFAPTTGGAVNLPFSVEQVLQEPGGNILSIGHLGDTTNATSQGVLESFTSANLLDPTFATSTNGFVTTDASANDAFYSAAVGADGKIVVVGGSNGAFLAARYNADGSLDASFGTSGFATADFGANDPATASSVSIEPDGSIILGGVANGLMALARFTSTGILDSSFNPGGVADAAFPAGGERTIAAGASSTLGQILLQGDGKILGVGNNGAGVAVFRLNANGTNDPSFGTAGITAISQLASQSNDGSANSESLALQPGGAILVSGQRSGGGLGVVRLTAAGQLDTSFSGGGFANVSFGGPNDRADNVIVSPTDGSFVLIGTTDITGMTQAVVAGFNADGSLNTNFGVNGKATFPAASTAAAGAARTRAFHPQLIDFAFGSLQPDGHVLVGNSNTSGGAVHRLRPFASISTQLGNPFGRINGRNVRLAPFTLADGTVVTITMTGGGSATAFETGNQVLLDINGPAAITIKTKGGANALSLSTVNVSGDLRSLNARTTTIAGLFSITGNAGNMMLRAVTGVLHAAGSINNLVAASVSGSISCGGLLKTANAGLDTGTIAAGLNINNFTAAAMSGATLLAGTNLGSDGQLGGSVADTYSAGNILSIRITGMIATSFIGAGINPTDGFFGDSNDTLAGPGGTIRAMTVRKGVDASTRFEAASFPKFVHLPAKVSPAADARFVVPPA